MEFKLTQVLLYYKSVLPLLLLERLERVPLRSPPSLRKRRMRFLAPRTVSDFNCSSFTSLPPSNVLSLIRCWQHFGVLSFGDVLSDSLGENVRGFSLRTETILETAKEIGALFLFFLPFLSPPSLLPYFPLPSFLPFSPSSLGWFRF